MITLAFESNYYIGIGIPLSLILIEIGLLKVSNIDADVVNARPRMSRDLCGKGYECKDKAASASLHSGRHFALAFHESRSRKDSNFVSLVIRWKIIWKFCLSNQEGRFLELYLERPSKKEETDLIMLEQTSYQV